MSNPEETVPVALTIAGSDSGGGAGLQADLTTFRFFGVHGTCAVTAVTAQNPHRVAAVHPVPPEIVSAQIAAVADAADVRAVKTGMLYSAELVRAVAHALGRIEAPLVVDPVMVATSGARLLQDDAVRILQERLLPLARVITPNFPEAAALSGMAVADVAQAARAARRLGEQYRCAVVITGGHGTERGTDVLWDGDCLYLVSTPALDVPEAHGTGCTFSAAIAAGLARGAAVLDAIRQAKAYVFGCLRHMRRIGPDAFALSPPPSLPVDAVAVGRLPGQDRRTR